MADNKDKDAPKIYDAQMPRTIFWAANSPAKGVKDKHMTIAQARELEQLRTQETATQRRIDLETKVDEIDRTISRRSGAWHHARTMLAFSYIEGGLEDRLTVRKAVSELFGGLLTPNEAARFERHLVSMVEQSFQAELRNLLATGVRPPAETIREMATLKSALRHRIRTALRIIQLETVGRQQAFFAGEPAAPKHPPTSERPCDVIMLKPSFCGMGIDLNELWRWVRPRLSKRNGTLLTRRGSR